VSSNIQEQNHRDLQYVAWGKHHGVLKKIDREFYRQRRIRSDTQSSCCSDSDQFADIRRQHHHIFAHPHQRYGWINLYGGALLIPAHSPLERHGQGRVLRHELYLGHVMQKGETVFYGHTPGGKARLRRLSVRDSFKLLHDTPASATRFSERQATNIRRYQETLASFYAERGREPTREEIMIYAEVEFDELHTIEEVGDIMSLVQAAELPLPAFLTHFQVDFEKLGGEAGKRRTYEFDCQIFTQALADPGARRELELIG